MKIKNIKKIGKREVFDIGVKDVEHYILENGVVSHNSSVILFSQNVLILSKSQIKGKTKTSDGKTIEQIIGYQYTININKSRFAKEKTKLTFDLLYDEGLQKYSGLLELAIESGHINKNSAVSFSKVDLDTGEILERKYKRKETNTKEFWDSILSDERFNDFIKSKYQLGTSLLVSDEDIEKSFDSIELDED